MREFIPIKPERRDTWRWKKPEYKPALLPQIEYPSNVRFHWWERVQWKSILENIGMFIVGILKVLPKTTLIGEALGNLFGKKSNDFISKLIELIQLLINKLKSWRKS